MKFKTFMNLVLAGGILLVGGTCYACLQSTGPGPNPEVTTTAMITPSPAASSTPVAATPTPADPGALRPADQAIIGRAGQHISGTKIKDALPGAWKVDLYQDNPAAGINRAKVDLNRNGKWDEKWTFQNEGGQWKVKRQVSPADNEQYTEEYRLREGRWVRK